MVKDEVKIFHGTAVQMVMYRKKPYAITNPRFSKRIITMYLIEHSSYSLSKIEY